MNGTIISLISLGALGFVFSVGLAVAAKKLAVEGDPRVDQINEALPGANCGACGFAGCRNFAESVAGGQAQPNGCPVGGAAVAKKIAEILGVETGEVPSRKVAQVLCKGGHAEATQRAEYNGPKDCRIANVTQGGDKGCTYGCLGFGTCVAACPFGAMEMNENGLPVVFEDKCTGCNKCVEACPRILLS